LRLAIILVAIVLVSGCVAQLPFELPFSGVVQETMKGPDFSIEVDPSRVFAGEETTIYIDVENNAEQTYDKIFVDVFDTGMMESLGVAEGGNNLVTGNVVGDACVQTALSFGKSFYSLYQCSNECTDGTQIQGVCRQGVCCLPTGHSWSGKIKLGKHCWISFYDVDVGDVDEWQYTIGCLFNVNSGGKTIPLIVQYTKRGELEEISMRISANWDDISAGSELNYDASSDTLYFRVGGLYLKNGQNIRVYHQGVVENLKVKLKKKNGKPTGEVELQDENGNVKHNLAAIARVSEEALGGPLKINLPRIESSPDILGEPPTLKTAVVEKAEDGTIKLELTEDSFSLEEPETPTPPDPEETETGGECETSKDCITGCQVCINNMCVDADSVKTGNTCEKSCQCEDGWCENGKCKTSNNWLMCEKEKRNTKTNELVKYYYCSLDCKKGVVVENGLSKSECYTKLGKADGKKSRTCTNTISDCAILRLSNYKCPVCWNGVCVESDQNQKTDMGCDLDCQCITGKCDSETHRCVVYSTDVNECRDKTPVKTCSPIKPKYCDEAGYLFNSCEICGCPDGKKCLSDGSCAEPNRCTAVFKDVIENDRKTLACRLKAPEQLIKNMNNDINVRMRYKNKLSAVQEISVISKEWFRRNEITGQLKMAPKIYTYRNRDLELTIEISDEMPLVVRDKEYYIHFKIRNIGNGMVYPIKLYSEFDIDQSEVIIDESCTKGKILRPDGKEFPKLTCKLNILKNVNYIKNFVISITIDYAYELRKSVPVFIIK
jgi:hypothetical protein